MVAELLLTPREVAEMTRLALPTIYKLAEHRRIPSLLVANRLRFRSSDIGAWLQASERPAVERQP